MFKDVKLIVSDLDGTLLSRDKTISDENIKCIKKLRDMGIKFTFASGRIHYMLESYINLLCVDIPFISCDGASLISYKNNSYEVLCQKCIDFDVALNILNFAISHNSEYLVYTVDGVYVLKEGSASERFVKYNNIAAQNGHKKMDFSFFSDDLDFSSLRDKEILKILIIEKDDASLEKFITYTDSLKNVSCVLSATGALDILPPDASKGNGILALSKHLDIPMQNICVLGDYYNDISMFEVAGYSISMKTDIEKVRNAATVEYFEHSDSAVARAINKYIFCEE